MVHVDFDQIENCDNYASVPNGTYLCQVGEVRARFGDDGSERWGVRWLVIDGPYAGRTAAWDNLSFGSMGLRRTKLILQRLEVPVDGPQEIVPSSIEGKRARVTVYARERIDPLTHRKVISNRVPFAGVESAAGIPISDLNTNEVDAVGAAPVSDGEAEGDLDF